MPVQGTQEALHSRARIDPSPAEARASWPLCTGFQAGARKGRRPHLFGEGLANDTVGSGGAALAIGASDYVVVNNLLFSTANGGTAITGDRPSSIENNLFAGFAIPHPQGATAAALNALDGQDLGAPRLQAERRLLDRARRR